MRQFSARSKPGRTRKVRSHSDVSRTPVTRAVNWLVFAFLLFFSVWATHSAMKISYATLLTDAARQPQVMAVLNGGIDADVRLRNSLVTLERAVSLVPNDADVAMEAGATYDLAAFVEQAPEARNELAESAIKHYEKAVELRGAWPRHYEELVDLYYLTDRPVEQQVDMLRELVKYGKWDKNLKNFILDQMAAYIDVLPADLQVMEHEITQYVEAQLKTEGELILEEIRLNSN